MTQPMDVQLYTSLWVIEIRAVSAKLVTFGGSREDRIEAVEQLRTALLFLHVIRTDLEKQRPKLLLLIFRLKLKTWVFCIEAEAVAAAPLTTNSNLQLPIPILYPRFPISISQFQSSYFLRLFFVISNHFHHTLSLCSP